MWLLIDDIRELNCDVIARTPEAGKRMLEIQDWECICFDHDLGTKESGYDVLMWGIANNLITAKQIQLVTSNPVGRERMESALLSVGYTTKDKITFWKNA